MNRIALLIGAGLLSITSAAPALSADFPRKAPVYSGGYGHSWTGFYVGINGGYGWGKSNWTNAGASTGDFNIKGPLIGGTLGYNLQNGAFVFGLEADVDASWIKGSDTTICGAAGCETRNRWLATGRGRIGYAWDRFMPYITGGVAVGDVRMTTPVDTSETKTKIGWTLGGGFEYAFMGPWSAKIEYNYVDLGTATCSAATCGLDTDVKFKANIVKLGVNYRF